MTHIAHKIELKPNHKAQAHFKSAFGVARFAYNEALAMWKQQYANGQKPLDKLAKRLTRTQRDLARSPRPRTKGEASGSNRLKKLVKLNRIYTRISNIRNDFTHKLSSALARSHKAIAVEDLNVKGMMRNHRLSRAIGDASFADFLTKLAYKCKLYGTELIVANRFYPSTKTCSQCGSTKEMSLSDRVYVCSECGMELDRDLNASLNLVKLISQIGGVPAELTPEDLTAMRDDLLLNSIATSEVETGIQHKSVCKNYENLL